MVVGNTNRMDRRVHLETKIHENRSSPVFVAVQQYEPFPLYSLSNSVQILLRHNHRGNVEWLVLFVVEFYKRMDQAIAARASIENELIGALQILKKTRFVNEFFIEVIR